MTEEKKHSTLGASSMYRWSVCAGSVHLCEGLPNNPGPAAIEGTRIHGLIEKFQRGDMPAEEYWKLDPKTRNSIKLYTDTVNYDYRNNQCKIFIEHAFDLSAVYPGCYGTADTVLWNPKEKVLYVYDYKNGTGAVEVENNSQLLYYALGALITLGFPAAFIEIVVVQPNATHKRGLVRRWRIPALEILDFEADLVAAADRTKPLDAPLVAGRHCYFCPAKNFCPARHKQRIEDAASRFSDVVEDDGDPFS